MILIDLQPQMTFGVASIDADYSWDDSKFVEAIKAGYEGYAVEDASGGTSLTAHNAACVV